MKNNKTKGYAGYLYILPWVIGFFTLQLVPLINSFIYSFTSFSILGSPKFIGLENYRKIFTTDTDFLQSLLVTFKYVVMAVPVKLLFALLIALILNQEIKGIGAFRTLYYLPSILGGSVAISVLWKFLFMKDGIVNRFLSLLHLAPHDWLGNPHLAIWTIGLVTVWQFGSSMILFLAGLKQIPKVLYEAAKIDGAGPFRIFWNFTPAFIITQGGPMKSTNLYGLMLYDQGFKFFKMGYASALSWILFAIILFFTGLSLKSSSSWVHYGDSI